MIYIELIVTCSQRGKALLNHWTSLGTKDIKHQSTIVQKV